MVESVTLVTKDPNDVLQVFNDRMPVMGPPMEYDTWLQGTPDEAAELPFPAGRRSG